MGRPVARRAIATTLLAATLALLPGQTTAPLENQRLEGLALPVKQVTLSAPMPGIVAELRVDEGDRVEQDQVLAVMDDRVQKVTVEGTRLQAQSTAEVRKAELARDEAQIMLERLEEAHANDAASDWEVRRLEVQRNQAEAEVVAAREAKDIAQVRLRLEEQRLSLYYIRAPFSGVIIRRIVEAGVTATTETQILSMAQLDSLEAPIFLPVEIYGQLRQGWTYDLTALAPVNRTIKGRLKLIDPVIDPASKAFRCVFEIENANLSLPAGFTVRLVWPQTPTPGPAVTARPATTQPVAPEASTPEPGT
ncbi:MAG: efflux RND transporter periplasmic adaptor subunit [Phycisphaeraceae bacterium]|nr:efflux RND transporter periplasmic adaptor subunit [Phycisphaeraceae bacterium]